MARIALYAIPVKVDREKLALLRRQLIHKHGGGHAVQYPIHCTLVRGVPIADTERFLTELRILAPSLHAVDLQGTTSLVIGEYWAGIGLRSNAAFERLCAALRALVAQHTAEAVPQSVGPHISLVYSARITGVSRIVSPIKHLAISSVFVARQEKDGAPYRVIEEIAIG